CAPSLGETSPLRGGSDLTSRRVFLRRAGLLAAVVAVERGWGTTASAQLPNQVVDDTLRGLVAFIVPRPDPLSVQQGQSSPEPGGIAAGAAPALKFAFDFAEVAPPPFTAFSQLVAAVLNQIAQVVNPNVNGPFASPFANLSFREKGGVFQAMEA